MFDRLDINFKYQVLMQEMSAVGIPPSSLQGCIDSVFRNKYLILQAFYVELTLIARSYCEPEQRGYRYSGPSSVGMLLAYNEFFFLLSVGYNSA